MRKILITGGAGFIGSALVRYIINETSDAVVVVDKLTYAGNLMSLPPTKYMVTCTRRMISSPKPRRMRRAALIPRQKPAATIWCAPGCGPTVCRR